MPLNQNGRNQKKKGESLKFDRQLLIRDLRLKQKTCTLQFKEILSNARYFLKHVI
jgi:hypothetical protein